jgi:hypothetical protein
MDALQVHKTEKGYVILHATEAHPRDFGFATNEWANSEDELRKVLTRLGLTEAAIDAGLVEVKDRDLVVFSYTPTC